MEDKIVDRLDEVLDVDDAALDRVWDAIAKEDDSEDALVPFEDDDE